VDRAGAKRRRRGVTVLEVIFSIGITAVGLLGVLAILPVAGSRVTRGTIADMADRVGRNAIREFDIRHMRQENMWAMFWEADLQSNLAMPQNPVTDLPDQQPFLYEYKRSRRTAFCIDPLFIATHVTNWRSQISDLDKRVQRFPYPASATHRMRRITLRYDPGALGSTKKTDSNNNDYYHAPPMVLSQAQQVFMSQDDLVFDLPDDRTGRPVQNFSTDETKRQTNGDYSWMATLVPREGNQTTDLYLLSIVVFHRRDMSMTLDYNSNDEPDPERQVKVVQFYGRGVGGGDVQLGADDEKNLSLKAGNWLMLSGRFRVGVDENDEDGDGNTTENLYAYMFRWYRVASTDDVQFDSTATLPYTCNVTLQGRDWTRSDWFVLGAQDRRRTTTPSSTNPTYATLVSNVVAVYEREISMETSSMWTVW